MKKFFVLILALVLVFSGCAPAEEADNHLNIIPFRPQAHEGQCPDADPYTAIDKEAFYANYAPACCLTNAKYRTKHGSAANTKSGDQYHLHLWHLLFLL